MNTLVKHEVRAQPVLVEELPAGLAGWDIARRLAGWPHLLFLDSAQASPLSRYSFVTADPFAWIWSKGRHVFTGDEVLLTWGDPFTILEDKLSEFPTETLPGLPPFQGGAA